MTCKNKTFYPNKKIKDKKKKLNSEKNKNFMLRHKKTVQKLAWAGNFE